MNIIKITKPQFRWLFGGIGFHNSEATMLRIMTDEFKNERVLKTFREISPTFSRVFAGYYDWTREAMDAFADYYDLTFRDSGTLIYLAPGRFPYITEDFDIEDYCERVAINFEYLVKERKCTKLRYYCVCNELSVGNTYAWFKKNDMELYKKIHACLYRTFGKHDLDIGLLATDCSFGDIPWAIENMDEITECYCAHKYCSEYAPGDFGLYEYMYNLCKDAVMQSRAKEKRFVLGEYGIMEKDTWQRITPMRKDSSYAVDSPENEGKYAIALCEIAMAAINSGTFAAAFWTMIDYPDPFIRENGDTPEEKERYDVSRFSGHGVAIRYNKHGLIRWCDDEKDYTSRAALYTMGYMSKLFKKGARVLKAENIADKYLRCSAVTNSDGTMSLAVINWADESKELKFDIEHKADKPFRKYVFCADNIPYNKFNDLQAYSETISANDDKFSITVAPVSITFLTTDYIERIPSEIKNISIKDSVLSWKKCNDEYHAYYRVYASKDRNFQPNGKNQICSTVAESIKIDNTTLFYKVLSVDRFGNTRLDNI